MQSSTISLLIPCFNSEDTISSLISEALSQSVPFHEIICYDDGSTDRTVEIIQSFESVKLLSSNLNKGPSYARNRLAEAAKGDFVHFHDSDDSILPGFVENMMSYLSKNSVVYCDMKVSQDNCVSYSSMLPTSSKYGTIWGVLHGMLHLNRMVIPTQAFLKVGGFSESIDLCEDKLLTIQLALAGLDFKYVNQVLVHRVRRTGSLLHRKAWNEKVIATVVMYEKLNHCLPKSLHSYVGEKLLDIAWDLHYRGFIEDSRYAVRIAQGFGTEQWLASDTFSALFSRMIGINNFFAARKIWSNIKHKAVKIQFNL